MGFGQGFIRWGQINIMRALGEKRLMLFGFGGADHFG